MMQSQTFSEQFPLGGFESPFESPFETTPEAGGGFEAGRPGPSGEDEVFT
jgi:hypothetical protein